MRIRVFVRKWNRGHAGIQTKFVVVFSVVMVKTQLKLWQQNCSWVSLMIHHTELSAPELWRTMAVVVSDCI
ncbi:unnamed protein product [Sphagnum troendelagicum]|uniref:Uncharacterized protein n=1 Tax=Sphagnum troendelagicum TaxID=128251 RepID=A0ABP0U7P4_9BRYO